MGIPRRGRLLPRLRSLLRLHLGEADREDARKLATRPNAGPKLRLSDEQIKGWEGFLLKGAVPHGRHKDLWSAHRVAEVIRRRFGVEYHTEHARKIIRRRLGRSSQSRN